MNRQVALTIAAFFILSMNSCSKSDDCTEVQINEVFEFQQSDLICLDSNTEIEIKSINDQRCPCNVQCVWEGEFIFELIIKKNQEEEIYLLHQKLENDLPMIEALNFNNIELLSQDSCNDPVPINEMKFEMSISR